MDSQRTLSSYWTNWFPGPKSIAILILISPTSDVFLKLISTNPPLHIAVLAGTIKKRISHQVTGGNDVFSSHNNVDLSHPEDNWRRLNRDVCDGVAKLITTKTMKYSSNGGLPRRWCDEREIALCLQVSGVLQTSDVAERTWICSSEIFIAVFDLMIICQRTFRVQLRISTSRHL